MQYKARGVMRALQAPRNTVAHHFLQPKTTEYFGRVLKSTSVGKAMAVPA